MTGISQLSRTYNIDISVLGAALETIGGRQVGRMRIELPRAGDDRPAGDRRDPVLRPAGGDLGP